MAEKAGKDEEMEKRITMIDTGEIMEHPNNPRKDLGDLTELAESVKLHGIMQNLIVINREEAVAGLLKEYEQTPSQIYEETLDKLRDRKAKYIVLLGHRRLAAAGEAGLDEVPCIVESGMTLNDQISLMLLENMQRNNLTIVEEAQSFQMMLDLGDTVSGVAEKSGFSESTVRRRVELAKLDRKKLETALRHSEQAGYQLTLTDLAKLERVTDIKERNRILDGATHGGQIENAVTRWIEDQQKNKHRKIILEKVAEIIGRDLGKAPKDYSPWNSKYTVLLEIECDRKPEPVLKKKETRAVLEKLPADAFFAEKYHTFVIATASKAEKKLTKQEKERKEREKRVKEIKNITKRGIKNWKELILQYIDGTKCGKKDKMQQITTAVFNRMEAKGTYVNERGVLIYERAEEAKVDEWWSITDEEREKWKEKYRQAPMVMRMLLHIVESFHNDDLVDWTGEFCDGKAESYQAMIGFLEEVADYEELDEEFLAVINGTHELFLRG